MSILIKGMEMPTRCADCKMYVEDIYCCQLLHREIENPWADDGVELDCPLVPIPPHGRLGDLDALLQEHERIIDSWGMAHIVSAQAVRNAPTIIEADEGET